MKIGFTPWLNPFQRTSRNVKMGAGICTKQIPILHHPYEFNQSSWPSQQSLNLYLKGRKRVDNRSGIRTPLVVLGVDDSGKDSQVIL
ncbi:hypothetical protein CDAR_118601 [Caerostris darwini]|uniref:Uncharacterized protein n=1 Tax=Caerostris darwini TaxID=1538125 RepID=A0AAV4WY10_9ARAC|nr:hypothetical protein CDAR_118601 [Caerostris darwini]